VKKLIFHLFDDAQLNEGGSLLETVIQGNIQTKLPKIPLEIADTKFLLKHNPPEIGEDTVDILQNLGLNIDEIENLKNEKIVF
jgi:crotonobetainyl-CoA:carnitine CoA-transferase CaiB-like acyl-CoA transferase